MVLKQCVLVSKSAEASESILVGTTWSCRNVYAIPQGLNISAESINVRYKDYVEVNVWCLAFGRKTLTSE